MPSVAAIHFLRSKKVRIVNPIQKIIIEFLATRMITNQIDYNHCDIQLLFSSPYSVIGLHLFDWRRRPDTVSHWKYILPYFSTELEPHTMSLNSFSFVIKWNISSGMTWMNK